MNIATVARAGWIFASISEAIPWIISSADLARFSVARTLITMDHFIFPPSLFLKNTFITNYDRRTLATH